jgi:hypothetical protein
MQNIHKYLEANNWQLGKAKMYYKSIGEYEFTISLKTSHLILSIMDSNDDESGLDIYINNVERLNKVIEAITDKTQVL